MNFFQRLLNKNAKIQPTDIVDFDNFSGWSPVLDTGATTFACLDKIASEFASLNFAVYDKKTRQKMKKHKILDILKQPNFEDRHFNFFYQSAIDYFNGGCFWKKLYSPLTGEVESLFRLNRGVITTERDTATNEIFYNYNGERFSQKDIVYIPSRFNYSTLQGGQSIFNASKSVFETLKQLEKFTQTSFSAGVLGKKIVIDISKIYHDGKKLSAKEMEGLRSDFSKMNSGIANTGKPILKENGMELSEIGESLDNKTAELLESRKFQEHEIAKIFGVPESLITPQGKDGGSIEDAFLLFNEFAIRPLASQFQDAINSLLDEDRYYFEFDYNGVLKVSFEKRIDAYIKQINNGLLSPNEARAKENMGEIEAGDNHFMPVNLMPLNDKTIEAYMAKQKNEIAKGKGDAENPTDENAQHFGGGDDKQ